jgi:hypothetical protein
MPMTRYKPEQIVTLLRQIEVAVANGDKKTPRILSRRSTLHTKEKHRG